MTRINWSNGNKSFCASLIDAQKLIRELYPNAVFSDSGDVSPKPKESEIREYSRILVWRNPEESIEDAGYNAVAEIVED